MSVSAEESTIQPRHFGWAVSDRVATITLDNRANDNALSFACYRELVATFRALQNTETVKCVVITGADGNFSSGNDAQEILASLLELRDDDDLDGLLSFTRMTSSLVSAMRDCPQPVVAAIDGVCAAAGAALAMASDMRYGTPTCRIGFPFAQSGLSGADMGACAILPRIVGYGRAAELLYTGRFMNAEEAERCGFLNRIVDSESIVAQAHTLANSIAHGPTFAHALTKRCMHHEWAMPIDDALAFEAEAQALCMQSGDFARAYNGFTAKHTPVFEGN